MLFFYGWPFLFLIRNKKRERNITNCQHFDSNLRYVRLQRWFAHEKKSIPYHRDSRWTKCIKKIKK